MLPAEYTYIYIYIYIYICREDIKLDRTFKKKTDQKVDGGKTAKNVYITRPPQSRVLSTNSKIFKQYTEHTKYIQDRYKINPKNLRSPRGQAPWGRKLLDLFCVRFVFILYVQGWHFVHGIFLVFIKSLTKPYSGEDKSYINIISNSDSDSGFDSYPDSDLDWRLVPDICFWLHPSTFASVFLLKLLS